MRSDQEIRRTVCISCKFVILGVFPLSSYFIHNDRISPILSLVEQLQDGQSVGGVIRRAMHTPISAFGMFSQAAVVARRSV